MITKDWLKNEWVEDFNECISGEKIYIKMCFTIHTNFSFAEQKIQEELRKKGSASIADIHVQPVKIKLNNITIKRKEGYLELDELILDENKFQTGLYNVELFIKRYINCQLSKTQFFNIISEDTRFLSECFKYVITFLGFSIIILPNSLYAYAECSGKWKKVVQIGRVSLSNILCKENNINDLIQELPDVINNILKCFENRKLQNIMELLNIGLRFEKNQLWREAFLNYYTIIETIFKETKFREEIINFLEKPYEFVSILCAVNQKIMMLFLWEYLVKSQKDTFSKIGMNNFIELANIRNSLSHEGKADITLRHLGILKIIMFNLLRKIYELL